VKFEQTDLKGVMKITPDIYEDFRGSFIETYNRQEFWEHGLKEDFVQDDLSVSANNVLRGLHGDTRTHKLVSCIYGRIYFVVVNCDVNSDEYGKWESFILSGTNRVHIYIPPKFANGYYVLSGEAVFSYKQSTYYTDSGKQFSYKWDDKRFGIWWPCREPLLSGRDS